MDYIIKISAEEMNLEFKRWGLHSLAEPKDNNEFEVSIFGEEENCVKIIYAGLFKWKTELFYFYLDKAGSLN